MISRKFVAEIGYVKGRPNLMTLQDLVSLAKGHT